MATSLSSPPPSDQPFFFSGFYFPNYTPVPDQVFDELLTLLSGAELKVLLYICRRTFGFKKDSDNISLNQLLHGLVKKDGTRLDAGTGLSKPTLLKALRDLQDKGIIEATRRMSDEHGDEATNYRLRFTNGMTPSVDKRLQPQEGELKNLPPRGKEILPPRGKEILPPRGKEILPGGWSKNFTTQETVVQETVRQETVRQETDNTRNDQNNNNIAPPAPASNVVVAFSSSFQEKIQEVQPHFTDAEPLLDRHASFAPAASIPLDPPSPAAANQAVAQALLAIGISQQVAQRLATRYRSERILEKLDYLAFLQTQRPDTVQNPRGWLRRAIEEDYGPPDGFVTAQESERRAADAAEQAQRVEAGHQAFAAQLQAQQEARQRQLQARYGTTAADDTLWTEVLAYFKDSRPDLYTIYAQAQILNCTDETVRLGFEHEGFMRRLDHPGTMAALKRQLKLITKRPLAVERILLPGADMGYPEKDGARSLLSEAFSQKDRKELRDEMHVSQIPTAECRELVTED